MKKSLFFLFSLIPFALMAQRYTIPADSLRVNDSTALNKYKGHKVDLVKPLDVAESKIQFVGLTAGEADKIKMIGGQTRSVVPRTLGTTIDTALFDVGKFLKNDTDFNVSFDDKPKGAVGFAVTRGVAGNPPKGDDNDDDTTFQSYIGALASATFVGNNKFLNNLTPIINLGGIVPVAHNHKGNFAWKIDVNPYIGATIDTKDSVSFIPALMLYGRGGLILNNYLEWGSDYKFTLMPFGFGLKFIPNVLDSNGFLTQHNIRFGAGFTFKDKFNISCQWTHGWLNTTSESLKNFKRIFGMATTDIDYLTVTGQFALTGKATGITNYVFFEWRGLLSKERFSAFTNNTILTLGIRKTLEIGGSSASFAAADNGKPKASKKKKLHYAL